MTKLNWLAGFLRSTRNISSVSILGNFNSMKGTKAPHFTKKQTSKNPHWFSRLFFFFLGCQTKIIGPKQLKKNHRRSFPAEKKLLPFSLKKHRRVAKSSPPSTKGNAGGLDGFFFPKISAILKRFDPDTRWWHPKKPGYKWGYKTRIPDLQGHL